MQKKHLFLAICLLASNLLSATEFPSRVIFITPETDCNVPAPDNFAVVSIGTTWIDLSWDFQPDAKGGYRIQTFRVSDDALISTKYKAWAETTVTIDALVSGEVYRCEISSRCEDGGISTQNKIIDPIKTIIGELIVWGVQGQYSAPEVCTINAAASSASQLPLPPGTSCTLYPLTTPVPTQTPFRISNGNGSLNFGITVTESGFSFAVTSCTDNEDNLRIVANGAGSLCPPINQVPSLSVLKNGVSVATLYIIAPTGTSRLVVCTALTNGYTIKKYPASAPVRDVINSSGTQSLLAKAAPNPFSNNLVLYLSHPTTGNVHLQLINLSGQSMLEQQFEANKQEAFSLPITGLPAGFYFLRIEADGEVQTLKVVKSE